ncbi:MAG: hypothetical protein K2L53_01330, partial [Clostridia bacterium]|nr:hypothetical protein [Clostridia bacterium]
MQALKKRKSIKYTMISIALLLCLAIAVISGAQSLDSAPNAVVTPTASATLNDTYGALFNGSTYRYTDHTKVEDMHSGARTDDTTVITVDSTKDHGSQENPFVIDSTAKWNAFAADMGNTSSGITDYGAGDYFVLAKNLDFSSSTFTPVTRFDGTFYGLGNTIATPVHNFGKINDCGAFGLITSSTLISDLFLQEVAFTEIGGYGGALVGRSNGGKILNCHATGDIRRDSSSKVWTTVGGLVGYVHNNDANLLVYRSSAVTTTYFYVINQTTGCAAGGIVGATREKATVEILDCYASMVADVALSSDLYSGSMLGFSFYGNGFRIENCAGYFFHKNAQNTLSDYHAASLVNVYADSSTPIDITIKNTYTDGGYSNGSSSYSTYPTVYVTPQQSEYNKTHFDISNVNWYANANPSLSSNYGDLVALMAAAEEKRFSAAVSDLWDAAKTDTYANGKYILSESIWTNRSNIVIHIGYDSSSFTFDDSPIVNKLQQDQF